jgi:ketosteroid isomerase-like protein
MKYFCFLLAAYLGISSQAGLLAVSDPDEEHVREVIAGLMRAWNVHDMRAFTEQFTDDASFVNVNGSWLRNAAQIEESHKVVHATIFKTSKAVIMAAPPVGSSSSACGGTTAPASSSARTVPT